MMISPNLEMAPIAIFVYRRPEHTAKTIAHLKECVGFENSPVYVFCDGAKTSAQTAEVQATRKIVHQMLGKQANIIEALQNMGLANSIVRGVNQLTSHYGTVIVIEDDLIVANDFLQFMNEALRRYANEERVMQVSGFAHTCNTQPNTQHASLLPFISSWGWATWSRAWAKFDCAASDWPLRSQDQHLRQQFNLDGAFDYAEMLDNQLAGRLDSWAIKWYWTVFKNAGLVLYPPTSKVLNIGFDGSGTHSGWLARRLISAEISISTSWVFPDDIDVDKTQFSQVKALFISRKPSVIYKHLKTMVGWMQAQLQSKSQH